MQTETDAVQERSNSIAAPSYRFCCLAGQALPKANNPIPPAQPDLTPAATRKL